jgi:hypothetical protein
MAFGNGPRIITTGLDLLVDAADRQSYPGSGTVWTDLKSGVTGSLTGSVSYTSEFYGGLTFSNSSSAVIFPSNVINYGTGSFTVEMAFKPTFINGRHYLMSENSGSFPNWAIYLSGSAGAGKLWSEFRISSTVSCSVSSSTTFVTGSVYQVDVVLAPGLSGSGITVNGIPEGGILGNGAGSLTNTGSLFIGNFSLNNTQNFSGSIYTVKTYSTTGFTLPVNNYNATSTRFAKPPLPETARKIFELLVVGGGGAGGAGIGGGGGAGGLITASLTNIPQGVTNIIVGDGGAGVGGSNGNNGSNSIFSTFIAFGGGRAGYNNGSTGSNGGSGGGGWGGESTGGPFQPGTGSLGQGNSGGIGYRSRGGGGGGAGSAGTSATGVDTGTGIGGSGSYIASFAAIGGFPSGWFAGGGSSGIIGVNTIVLTPPGGGGGGIGNGFTVGTTGSTNTGAGGGGGTNGGSAGGKGGSGIVAIRYSGGPIAIGGEITQSAGYTYHVFRTVGTSSFTIF